MSVKVLDDLGYILDCVDGVIDWIDDVDLASVWNQVRRILNKVGRGIRHIDVVLELDVRLHVH